MVEEVVVVVVKVIDTLRSSCVRVAINITGLGEWNAALIDARSFVSPGSCVSNGYVRLVNEIYYCL